jgi:putative nucleotidyltransferase with HDIG domain
MIKWKTIVDLFSRVREWRVPGEVAVKVALGILLVVLLALMFPRAESLKLEYKLGAIWAQKDLIAPFSFPILREEKDYAKDVEEAKKRVYEVFEKDTQAVSLYVENLDRFMARLNEALVFRAEARRALRLHLPGAGEDSSRFARTAGSLEVPFTEKEWDVLASLAAGRKLGRLRDFLLTAGKDFLAAGIIDRPRNSIARGEIAVRQGTVEEIVSLDRLLDQNDVVVLLGRKLESFYGTQAGPMGVAYKIGITHLTPNIRYSPAGTDQAVAAAIDAVPRTVGFVQENERIISKHERITPETRLKLDSFQRARLDRGAVPAMPLQFLGNVLHVAVILVLFMIYLSLFRKRIIGNNRRLTLIAFLFLLIGFLAYLTRELDITAPIEYLIVIPAASMLLTIIFDSRVGFYGTVTMALIVGGIRGNDYSVALAGLVAGALAVFSVRDMKNRSQIFRSLVFIFLGYGVVVVGLGLERSESLPVLVEQLLFCLANAVVSPVLTYGLLIFLERVFKVTTDLTLIELAQFNHPLLRLLAEKAPGTYHHSMTMASLTEAGAAAVGANEVLARVAAYFHDVGKILKPTYFVENQRSTRSRHDKLSPRMSSLIIAAHVKDGVALAQEYGLPEEIIEFIPMHHGTTRIDFFYAKAVKLAEQDPDETKVAEINEGDYRYPGPKPQTKETGIMMLADAVEAAVRTVDDPTPQRLQDIIEEIIKRRFEEGELDECPLTVKDLTKIKGAFLNVLVGVYHTRVKYPEPPKKPVRRRVPAEPRPESPAEPSAGPEGPDHPPSGEIDREVSGE